MIAKLPDGLVVSGPTGSPDLQRGNQARLAGRLEDAERDLLPLAEMGYPDAQLYLAAIYGQNEEPQSQELAIKWYRTALTLRPEADVPLARVLMRRGDRASALEAQDILLNAQLKRRDPAALAALLDLVALYPQFDEQHRGPAFARTAAVSELIDLRIAAIGWYRASVGEPDNARRLIEVCRKNLDIAPACYVDLALYHRYSQDRKGLEQLIDQALRSWQEVRPTSNLSDSDTSAALLPSVAGRLAMSMVNQPLEAATDGIDDDLELQAQVQEQIETASAEEDAEERANRVEPPKALAVASSNAKPSNAQPELADKILRWMLKQPGAMPTEAAGVAVSFPYLLPDVDLEKVLNAGAAADFPHASLYLGQLYYFNQRTPRNAVLGEQSLLRSIKSRETVTAAHYRLGRLYQQGYLGSPDPQKALDNFLYAARRRVTAADTHLARLFYDTPGAKINRINSYVFARLSGDAGVTVVIHSIRGGQLKTYKLLDRLRADLTEDELRSAEQLYQQECDVHLVNRVAVSPEIWVKAAAQ